MIQSKLPRSARRHVVDTLTNEILTNPRSEAFPIESEYQLCRRFKVSRVTVRLALGELVNRGLIYRKHGRGTFAHGRSTRAHRFIAILSKIPPMVENRPLSEFARGAYSFMRTLKSGIVVLEESPKQWNSNLACILTGVVVVTENVTSDELESLKNRNLPFLLLGQTGLAGPRIRLEHDAFTDENSIRSKFFRAGQLAAEALNRASLTGKSVDDILDVPPTVPLQLEPLIQSAPSRLHLST
jgi:DNA-binding transcriptional regulator YhcF (GntR family)